MTWEEILAALLDQPAQALVWVLGSLALYLGWARLSVRVARRPADRLGRLIAILDRPWAVETGRSLYYVGIPYLALLQGVINPQVLGLTRLDWFVGLGYGLPLGAGALILCALVWQRVLEARPSAAALLMNDATRFAQPWGWSYSLVGVVYLQAHWAFYRAVFRLLSGDLYLGTFVGLGLVTLETTLDPRPAAHLGRGDRLWRLNLALVTAVIYFFTQNLWLTTAVHLTIEMAILGLVSFRLQASRGLRGEE
ncbi:MAG: hypothetical protein HYZ68_00265 [Chloroflexi bacterium]|nr:hypothetical protein [Chloroflexota bacterium]